MVEGYHSILLYFANIDFEFIIIKYQKNVFNLFFLQKMFVTWLLNVYKFAFGFFNGEFYCRGTLMFILRFPFYKTCFKLKNSRK